MYVPSIASIYEHLVTKLVLSDPNYSNLAYPLVMLKNFNGLLLRGVL